MADIVDDDTIGYGRFPSLAIFLGNSHHDRDSNGDSWSVRRIWLSIFAFLKFWGKPKIPEFHVKIESPREQKGSVLVVFGVAIELLGAVGTIVQSLVVDSQHRKEIAQLQHETAQATVRAANAEKETAVLNNQAAQTKFALRQLSWRILDQRKFEAALKKCRKAL